MISKQTLEDINKSLSKRELLQHQIRSIQNVPGEGIAFKFEYSKEDGGPTRKATSFTREYGADSVVYQGILQVICKDIADEIFDLDKKLVGLGFDISTLE